MLDATTRSLWPRGTAAAWGAFGQLDALLRQEDEKATSDSEVSVRSTGELRRCNSRSAVVNKRGGMRLDAALIAAGADDSPPETVLAECGTPISLRPMTAERKEQRLLMSRSMGIEPMRLQSSTL